jgi:hypothetical protein
MKQAIVDRNPLVSSSALVAGMHLMGKSPEIVRRWYVTCQHLTPHNQTFLRAMLRHPTSCSS